MRIVTVPNNVSREELMDDADEKHCFKNLQDMVDYFRKEYGKYLPEDFDYEKHMVEF